MPRGGSRPRKVAAAKILGPQEYFRAAAQRLAAANYLLDPTTFNLEAYYLAGYTIECALKSLILSATPLAKRKATYLVISQGGDMHSFDVLMKRLFMLNRPPSLELLRQLRSSSWSTGLRYHTGRWDHSDTRDFLKTAQDDLDWVSGATS